MKLSLLRRAAIATIIAASIPSLAQAQDETLFGNGPRDIGGFGGPIYRVTQLSGETMALVGGGGGVLINRRFILGGMGVGGTNHVDAIIGGTPLRGEMDFGYGGVTLGVITRPSKLVHATYGLMIGGGGISVWPDDLRPRNPSDSTEYFGVAEPQVGLELNVTKWMRLGLTGGYRFVFGAEVPKLADDNLSGASGSLVFKFGKF